MGTVLFYHLTRSTPVETLAVLLPRALGQGWPVMVRGTAMPALERLDGQLWLQGGDNSFLPHGLEGGPQDADQPVLLGLGPAVNRARVLALIDGAQAAEAELAALERVWILFDGNDMSAVQSARVQWKAITAAGHPTQYWSEESGRWEKKADSAPRSV